MWQQREIKNQTCPFNLGKPMIFADDPAHLAQYSQHRAARACIDLWHAAAFSPLGNRQLNSVYQLHLVY